MSDLDSPTGNDYQLPRELLDEVRKGERYLRDVSEQVQQGYLTQRTFPVLRAVNPAGGADVEIENTDLLNFLSPLVRVRAIDSAEGRPHPKRTVPFKTKAGRIIVAFIKLFFDEIRKRICGNRKANFAVGPAMALALTSLAHWLAGHFRLADELSRVTASAILVAIASATKGAFCRLTADGALAAIIAAAQ